MRHIIQNRDGKNIVALYHAAGGKGLAFILHGLSGYKEQPHIATMAAAFHEAGIDTVIFDATNSFGESGGVLEDATLTRHAADLHDVIAWASTQDWYVEPFYLAGHSMGGGAVLDYALRNPARVKAMAPTATVLSHDLWIKAQQMAQPEALEKWRRDGYRLKESVSKPGASGRISWNLMEDMKNHDFVAAAGHYKMPTLLVVGDKDVGTPPLHQKMLFAALTCDKEYHEIEGCEHTFTAPPHLEKLKRIFADWIRKTG